MGGALPIPPHLPPGIGAFGADARGWAGSSLLARAWAPWNFCLWDSVQLTFLAVDKFGPAGQAFKVYFLELSETTLSCLEVC